MQAEGKTHHIHPCMLLSCLYIHRRSTTPDSWTKNKSLGWTKYNFVSYWPQWMNDVQRQMIGNIKIIKHMICNTLTSTFIWPLHYTRWKNDIQTAVSVDGAHVRRCDSIKSLKLWRGHTQNDLEHSFTIKNFRFMYMNNPYSRKKTLSHLSTQLSAKQYCLDIATFMITT